VSLVDWAQVIGGGFVVLGVLVAITQVLLTQANERRRAQGIVIAHQTKARLFAAGSGWTVEAAITNEGQGPVFNVRFGVSIYGVRCPFRMEETDPLSGNRQRVLRPQERRPEAGGWPIPISGLAIYGGAWKNEEPPEEKIFYWARYEDAQGRTYETVNPPDRSADLKIRRVRFVVLRESWNARRHRKGNAAGREWEATVREEFRSHK
jgi:hypothetical protein